MLLLKFIQSPGLVGPAVGALVRKRWLARLGARRKFNFGVGSSDRRTFVYVR